MHDDETVDEMIRRRRGDPRPAVLFEDERWTWDEHARASATRAALARGAAGGRAVPHRVPARERPRAQLLARRRRGVRRHDGRHQPDPPGSRARDRHPPHRLPARRHRAQARWRCSTVSTSASPATASSSSTPTSTASCATITRTQSFPDAAVPADAIALLVFTSGTSGAPKAAIVSQRRLARYGRTLSAEPGAHRGSRSATWRCRCSTPTRCTRAGRPRSYVGATIALRRRFSASGFLDDVRRYGATYFNYVGKPLSYILATPPRPDDRDHTLVRVVGNEGTEHDIARFSERFGVPVIDNYGSTEGGVTVMRSPDQPKGALGRLPEGALVVDPESGAPCAPARVRRRGPARSTRWSASARSSTPGRARSRATTRTTKRSGVRTRNGWYWSGDLGYADADGWLWFAGRDYDWLRVDGENFAAAPVERIVGRFPGVVLGAVYAVPAADVGDEVMVALAARTRRRRSTRRAFDEFLAGATRPRRQVEPAVRARRRPSCPSPRRRRS